MPNATILTPALETLNNFASNTYDAALKQMNNGLVYFQHKVCDLQNEVSNLYDNADAFMQQMDTPVNNFLKNINDIDTDFKKEVISKDCMVSGLVPLEIALLSPMEENY